jgi:phosphodiesterase/alkaline phosphatase D-like protein
MKRREAGLSILGITFLATQAAEAALPPATLPNGVAAGDVTQASVVLWTRTAVAGNITLQLATDAGFTNIIRVLTKPVVDPTKPFKSLFQGLLPNTTYFYRATSPTGEQATGTFRTAAPTTSTQGLRFGISGDWRGELSPYPAIKNVPSRNLAFFVEFGDTIYADFPSPAVNIPQCQTLANFRAKHSEVYGTRFGLNTWADLRSSTAIFSMIDDHEVINDFSGGAAPSSDARFDTNGAYINETNLYKNGLQAFQEYNPIQDLFYGNTGDPRTANKRKLYRYRTFGKDAAMFLLDTRSFRSAPLTPVADITNTTEITNFLVNSFNPTRTMLGAQQLADLKADLLNAQSLGITWKFILVPEPIQNLGVLGGEDRFEGYAAERTAILSFIKTNNIKNVVFVTADIHGTVINNLSYQVGPGQPQIATDAFEISTGSVAFDAPFGPTVAFLAFAAGIPGTLNPTVYASLPAANQEVYITQLTNGQLSSFGYPLLGLTGDLGSRVTLLQSIAPVAAGGGWTATNSYGWTEFEIAQASQLLTITTYGIPYYTQTQIEGVSTQAGILASTPAVVHKFTVQTQP